MRKVIILVVIVGFLISVGFVVCVSYAGIRVKSHGGEVLNPNLSYIVSETVSTATENDGKMKENRREHRGRNDGAPSRSVPSS